MKVMDIHVHGIGGYDTRTSSPDHILRMAEILGSHGVSEILPTIYASTIKAMRKNMETVKLAMQRQKLDPDMHEGKKRSARIAGLNIEGPFLNTAKCGTLAAETFIEPGEYAFGELMEGFEDIVRIITIAPELRGALRLIRMIADSGIIASMGHSDATYAEAEEGFHAGARGITHIFNAMRGFHHREPGLAGFGLMNREIYAEVIADPFHLHPKALELVLRTKDHDKIIIISDAIKETKADGGRVDGIFDVQGSLMGGTLTVAESAARLISEGYGKALVEDCVARNPAAYLSAGQN